MNKSHVIIFIKRSYYFSILTSYGLLWRHAFNNLMEGNTMENPTSRENLRIFEINVYIRTPNPLEITTFPHLKYRWLPN